MLMVEKKILQNNKRHYYNQRNLCLFCDKISNQMKISNIYFNKALDNTLLNAIDNIVLR